MKSQIPLISTLLSAFKTLSWLKIIDQRQIRLHSRVKIPSLKSRFYILATVASLSLFVTGCDEGETGVEVQVISGTMSGTVTAEGSGLANVTVSISGAGSQITKTDSNGNFTFTDLPGGAYAVTISNFPSDVTFPATSKAATISRTHDLVVVDFNGTHITATLNIKKEGSGVVTSADGKIDCGDDCSEEFKWGTEVKLSATPAEAWVFAGWEGDLFGSCSEQTEDCTVSMVGDKMITAIFTEDPLSLVFPDPIVCIEHGTSQSEILWLWKLAEVLEIQIDITMLVKLPNGEEIEIDVTSQADALKILIFLDIFTFGNYDWEITSVKYEGEDISFSGTTSGTVEVDADEQNAGECS